MTLQGNNGDWGYKPLHSITWLYYYSQWNEGLYFYRRHCKCYIFKIHDLFTLVFFNCTCFHWIIVTHRSGHTFSTNIACGPGWFRVVREGGKRRSLDPLEQDYWLMHCVQQYCFCACLVDLLGTVLLLFSLQKYKEFFPLRWTSHRFVGPERKVRLCITFVCRDICNYTKAKSFYLCFVL